MILMELEPEFFGGDFNFKLYRSSRADFNFEKEKLGFLIFHCVPLALLH